MPNKVKYILVIVVCFLPVYGLNIYVNFTNDFVYSASNVLFKYLGFVFVSLSALLLLNKYFLSNSLKWFNQGNGTWLMDVAIGFLLLAAYYFFLSIGHISYYRWFNDQLSNQDVLEMLRVIYSNPLYLTIQFSLYIIIAQGFWAVSVMFILNFLWERSPSESGDWISIICVTAILSLVNAQNGMAGIIFWFLVNLASSITYYKYRRAFPLLIAYILFQYFDAIGIWYYFQNHPA